MRGAVHLVVLVFGRVGIPGAVRGRRQIESSNSATQTLLFCAASLAFSTCVPSGLCAQAIRGRVLLPDSLTPVAGVAVSLLDDSGVAVARAVSSKDGGYAVQLPRAGTFEFRVLRIGFRPTRVRTPYVPIGETVTLDIVLASQIAELPTFAVTGRDDCQIRGAEADMFLTAWERARGALAAARLPDDSIAMDIHGLTIQGTEDEPGVIVRGKELDPRNRHWQLDSSGAREFLASHLFATTPIAVLATGGYVRLRQDGSVIFDVPSADMLLSDSFLERHCFGVDASPSDHGDWIGIRFFPTASDTITDVAGTLWLDRTSGTLRRLDFSYTNLQYAPARICNQQGRVCFAPPSGAGIGGTLIYSYMRSGEWLVSQWHIRTPAESYELHQAPFKVQVEHGRVVDCDRGPACERVQVPVPRLNLNEGMIAAVARNGVAVYRDTAVELVMHRIDERQAGKFPAGLSGLITDPAGRPLRRAVIAVANPVRVSVSDDSGHFTIRTLPAKVVGITVSHQGYENVGFRLQLLSDSTRYLKLTMIPRS